MVQDVKPKQYQVVGIGNAVVDVLSHVEYEFLDTHGIEPGIMQLINLDRAIELYNLSDNATEVSGGSAANTVAGLAKMGLSTAYIGKVKDDQLGATFAQDIRSLGATYTTKFADNKQPYETGRSLIMITPESERSMNTYLGAAEFLSPEDIDPAIVGNTDWLYLEGYRFDGPGSHQAFQMAIDLCHQAGGQVAIALSDPFCVNRHRTAFQELVENKVDLVFGNEAEILSLYQDTSLDEAIAKLDQTGKLIMITLSEKGALAVCKGKRIHVKAEPTNVVDATGAGDQFAAGCFYGLAHGFGLEKITQFGCIAASEVIEHTGPRPQSDVLKLIQQVI